MASEVHELKSRQNFDWIKSKSSGNVYLCPAGSIKNKDKASEAELRRHCVDDSHNPHN